MTEEGHGQAEGRGKPLGVLDAVVCVHFAGANLARVLTAALAHVGVKLLVPAEVGCVR